MNIRPDTNFYFLLPFVEERSNSKLDQLFPWANMPLHLLTNMF